MINIVVFCLEKIARGYFFADKSNDPGKIDYEKMYFNNGVLLGFIYHSVRLKLIEKKIYKIKN